MSHHRHGCKCELDYSCPRKGDENVNIITEDTIEEYLMGNLMGFQLGESETLEFFTQSEKICHQVCHYPFMQDICQSSKSICEVTQFFS